MAQEHPGEGRVDGSTGPASSSKDDEGKAGNPSSFRIEDMLMEDANVGGRSNFPSSRVEEEETPPTCITEPEGTAQEGPGTSGVDRAIAKASASEGGADTTGGSHTSNF